MRNRLVVIGWLGIKRCYVNVSKDDAISRYLKSECQDEIGTTPVQEYAFDDEFNAYDAWGEDIAPVSLMAKVAAEMMAATIREEQMKEASRRQGSLGPMPPLEPGACLLVSDADLDDQWSSEQESRYGIQPGNSPVSAPPPETR